MPREAVRLGAAQQVLALPRIGPFLEQENSEPPSAKNEQPHRAG
jgi:hypothetical protein